MFSKKETAAVNAQAAVGVPPLYKVVHIPSGLAAASALNQATSGGTYRFLEWLDDKWERNGYAGTGERQAIYIKQ